jgi:hypothetical protein
MSNVIEYDNATSKRIQREFTEQELAQREFDQIAFQKAAEKAAAQKAANKTLIEASIAHAKSLGFTDAMVAVMYPQLEGA